MSFRLSNSFDLWIEISKYFLSSASVHDVMKTTKTRAFTLDILFLASDTLVVGLFGCFPVIQ